MFKSKAINAQGTIIAIDDGTGVAIADITAVTKANPIVVSSIGAAAAEGDVVRFIDVANMPELSGMSGVVSAAGVGTFTVEIDGSGFAQAGGAGTAEKLAFVPGCEAKTFSGLDGAAAEVDITTLCSTAREYLMGLQDFGSFSMDVNLVPNDPFQQECNQARSARESRTFTLTFPPGQDDKVFQVVFDAFVKSFSIAGGVDQALTGTIGLRVTGEPTWVEVTW